MFTFNRLLLRRALTCAALVALSAPNGACKRNSNEAPATVPTPAPAPAPAETQPAAPAATGEASPEVQPDPPPVLEASADSIAADRLAGLPVGTALQGEGAERLTVYADAVQARWGTWEAKIGAPMARWGPERLPQSDEDTVFYPFSGPDFSTVHRLYPRAHRYVLVAMQKAGPPLHLAGLRPRELDEALDLLTLVFSNFTQKGFFITERMNSRFGADQPVKGLTPILMAFAAREGFMVESVEPIWVADDGRVQADPGDPAKLRTWDSVRLNLRARSDGRAVTLDYLRINLADRRIRDRKNHMDWVQHVSQGRVFVKAASHLMQQTNFAIIRDTLLTRPVSLLQDESGVPYARLKRAYDVRLFGDFTKVNTLFHEEGQLALAEAYAKRKDVEALPFEIGYKKRSGSCLQLATRAAAAKPAPIPDPGSIPPKSAEGAAPMPSH